MAKKSKGQFIWIKPPDERQTNELLRLMNDMPDKVVRKAIRAAFGVIGRKIAKTAQGLAPVREFRGAKRGIYAGRVVRPGILRRSIKSRFVGKPPKTKSNPTGAPVMKIGAMKGNGLDPWYAHFVEYGTRHSKAKPFLRPARDQHEASVQPALIKALRQAFAKQFKKLRKI